MSEVRVKVRLTFPESEVRRAVLATMVRRFDVEPNIRRADVEAHRGWIICEVDGEAAQVEAALDWLRNEGITVDLLGDVLEGCTLLPPFLPPLRAPRGSGARATRPRRPCVARRRRSQRDRRREAARWRPPCSAPGVHPEAWSASRSDGNPR